MTLKDPTSEFTNPPVFLGPGDLDADDVTCTKCKGKNINLTIKAFYIYEEHQQNGLVVYSSEEELPTFREEIASFYCRDCDVDHFCITQHAKDLVDSSNELKDVLNI